MSFQQQQQESQSGSFRSDNTVTTFRFISAIAAVTVATSSVFLWRIRRTSFAEAKHDPEPIAPAPSSLQTALPHDVVPLQGPKGKASRSKERRRRGKDLFKELSRGGKKHKELHRQLNRHSTTSPAEQDHPQLESSPVKSSGSSHVQISGPSQLRELTPDAVDAPRPSIDRPQDDTVSRSLAGKFDLPAPPTNEERPVEDPLPSQDSEVAPPDPSEEPSTSQDGPCEASIDLLTVPSRALGSHTPSPSQGTPHSGVTSEWDGKLSEPPPRFAAVRATNPQSRSCPSLCSPASFSPTHNHSTLSDLSSPTLLTCPTLALRVGGRRMPILHPPSPSPNPVSAQTQIASLRGALEAARLREEKSRMEAECRTKEYDALRRRWMEEIASRQHREAQLHAYIQYLTHVLQMYAGAYPPLTTRVPIFPALVGSPLPGAFHSITMHQFHHPVLENTRGRRRKREVQDDRVVGNSDIDVLPLCNEVAGAILKRPENLRAGSRPMPPRFHSLPDMGHVWYVGETGTENLSEENRAATEENEVMGEENGYLSQDKPSPDMDITRVREENIHVDQ